MLVERKSSKRGRGGGGNSFVREGCVREIRGMLVERKYWGGGGGGG